MPVVEIAFEPEAEFAIQMDFDGYAFFQGDDTPSTNDVYWTMANADYNRFLDDFIFANMEGLFLGVLLVEFSRQA